MEQYIIIGFSNSKGFKPFSWLIRLFEGTNISHTYLKLSNRHFNDYDIYQASKGMVNHIVESNFLEDNNVIAEFSLPISSEEKMSILNDIRYRLGKPYSMTTVLGIFLSKLGIKWAALYDGDKGYICSELVARILKASGKMPIDIDMDKATPRDLYKLCDLYATRIK